VRLCTSERKVLWYLALASVPAAIVGIFFQDAIESLFAAPRIVGVMLIATGLWLLFVTFLGAYRALTTRPQRNLGVLNACMVGLAQACAIIPGISRSGSTIGAGLVAGLEKTAAFRFAFLLAIPAIGGATVLKARHIGAAITGGQGLVFLVGGVCALLAGLASIRILLRVVQGNKLYVFGIYCMIVGGMVIIFFK